VKTNKGILHHLHEICGKPEQAGELMPVKKDHILHTILGSLSQHKPKGKATKGPIVRVDAYEAIDEMEDGTTRYKYKLGVWYQYSFEKGSPCLFREWKSFESRESMNVWLEENCPKEEDDE